MDTYTGVLKKYATFAGRAGRKEYWTFFLVNLAIGIILTLAAQVVGTAATVLYYAFVLATLVPGIAVAVRRLHDTGRSGAWCFIAFIPLVGLIILLVLMLLDSKPGPNEYGPHPEAEAP